jgi:hypothetical protein
MRAVTRLILGYEFWLVGELVIERDAHGRLLQYSHALPPDVRPNPFSAGPFCRFGLSAAPHAAGVYAIIVDGTIQYIGECVDLAKRFGSTGYGLISPRNCHHDGQSTNCRLNSRVLAAAATGVASEVWFRLSDDRHALEASLIAELGPAWNARRESVPIGPGARRPQNTPAPAEGARGTTKRSRNEFRDKLDEQLVAAERTNGASVRIRAGDLHRAIGGYPGPRHRMPSCCAAMRAAMQAGDRIVQQPPKGDGASLIVEYQVPRIRG